MQSLWSRAGQARHCGCRTCSQVIQGAGRRATTRVQRRKTTFTEIFTACYTSMFASAALVDAIRKEDRRQELDRQLDEARRELAALQKQATRELPTGSRSPPMQADTTEFTIDQMDALYQSIRSIAKSRPFMKEIKNPAEPSASDLIEGLKREYYRCPDEQSVRELGQIKYDALEQGLMAEETDWAIPRPRVKNNQALYNTSIRSIGLIKKLLRQVHENDEDVAPSPILEEVRELVMSAKLPWYSPNANLASSMEKMSSLNRSITSIMAAPGISWQEKIGKVCYNLISCPYPPDVHTYNTMVVAFDRAGLYNLSEEVVFSFLFRQNMKPTPLTTVAILNHYKESGLAGSWIGTMSGLAGGDRVIGSKLHRMHVGALERHKRLQDWAADTKRRTVHGDWMFEHVPLSRPVVENVVHGLLHFKLFDAATAFFVSCIKSGVVLDTRVTRQLLDASILALDWKAAVRLIRELTNSDQIWQGMVEGADVDTISYFVDRLYVLFDLSGTYRTGRTPSIRRLASVDISRRKLLGLLRRLEDATSSTDSTTLPVASAPRLMLCDAVSASKSRLLQIESLWKEYVVARSTIVSLERKLIRVVLPPALLNSLALHIGNAAVEQSLESTREFQSLVDGGVIAELSTNGQAGTKPLTRGDILRSNGKQTWYFDLGVWVHDLLVRQVLRHSQPIEQRKTYVEKKTPRVLDWLLDWERAAQVKVPYPQFFSKLPERGFFWEGRK